MSNRCTDERNNSNENDVRILLKLKKTLLNESFLFLYGIEFF